MKTIHLSLVRAISVGAIALLGMQAANAAPLGLVTERPDLTTYSASLDYVFESTCSGVSGNGASGTGPCGTDNGLKGQNKITYSTPVSSGGTLTMSGSSMILDAYSPSTGLDPISGGSYSLVATFDGTGTFTGGTVTALGTASSGDPNFQSGNLVTANLTEFGFSGTDDAGSLEFTFNDAITGDFAAFYYSYSAIIATTTTMKDANGVAISGDWDANLDFTQNFSATSANIDTSVPIPAAVWLFGSAIMGLFGLGRARRRTAAKI